MSLVKDSLLKLRKLLLPLVRLLIKLDVSPNTLTICGFILTIPIGVLYATGNFTYAALMLLIVSLFDVLDGDVARLGKKVSKFGAFLDSTLDRFTEYFIFSGFIYYFRHNFRLIFLLFTALFLSLMVSYTRARGEGLGYSTRKGPMDRVMRLLYLIIISFLPRSYFEVYMVVFIILTFLTVIRRILDLRKLNNI